MLFKPLLGDQLSGSAGGIVASHNRGGTYFRQRAIPVNPQTPEQVAVRGFLSQLTSIWVNTLSVAQRTAWDVYALNVLIPNRLGDPRNIGGVGQYVRSNVPRLQAGLPRVDNAPTVFDLGDFTDPTIISITAPTALSLGFTESDAWVSEDDAGMLVLASRGQNASINFFKGPYRFADSIDGEVAIPPTTPAAIVLPFIIAATQRVFIEVKVSRADGRLSSTFRNFGTAV